MKRFLLLLVTSLLMLGLVVSLGSCGPLATALPPLPTSTGLPPTASPTATIVWFPPTPTTTTHPTRDITPTVEAHPQAGSLIFSDDFSSPDNWTLGRSAAGSASITGGELTLAVSQTGGYLYSLRRQPELRDFYAEITASPSLCRAADEYGLLLRASGADAFYRFSLTCDGQVRLDKYFNGRASSPQPLTPHGAVPPGAPSSSRIGVTAQGKKMDFFVNGEFAFTVSDPSLVSGSLGVFARSEGDTPVTVNFTGLEVYETQD